MENSNSEASPSPRAGDLPVPGALDASTRPPACLSSSDVQFSPVSRSTLTSLSEIFCSRVATLFHVPKSAWDSWSEVLLFALRAVSDRPNDLEAWARLLMLPKCILFLPPLRPGRKRFLAPIIKDRFKAWREGSYQDLWVEACKRSAHSPTPQSPSYNVHRACGASHNGHFQKALRALGSSGLALPDSESFAAMLSKHPQCSPLQVPSFLMHPLPSHPSPPCLFDSAPTVPPLCPPPLPMFLLPFFPIHPILPQPPSFIFSGPPLPSFPLSPSSPSAHPLSPSPPTSSHALPLPTPSHFPLFWPPSPPLLPPSSSISISVSAICRSVLSFPCGFCSRSFWSSPHSP